MSIKWGSPRIDSTSLGRRLPVGTRVEICHRDIDNAVGESGFVPAIKGMPSMRGYGDLRGDSHHIQCHERR